MDDTGDRNIGPDTVTSPEDVEAGARSTRIDKQALIGSQTRVTGDMTGEENLHIEGHVVGRVTFIRHVVSIGVDGSVEGDVVAQSLTVGGTIRGRLIASGSVRVLAGAHVSGEIHSPGLVIEEGAEFQGTVDMNPDNPLLDQQFDTAPADDVHEASISTYRVGTPVEDYPESAGAEGFDEDEDEARSSH